MIAAEAHRPLDKVRRKLEETFGQFDLQTAEPPADRVEERLIRTLSEGIKRRRLVDTEYVKVGEEAVVTHTLEPYWLERQLPHWYVHTWDRTRGDVRSFRLDRMRSATLRSETFEPREGFEPDRLRDARVARIHYSKQVARWEVERGAQQLRDGTAAAEQKVGGTEWLVGEILRFRGEASCSSRRTSGEVWPAERGSSSPSSASRASASRSEQPREGDTDPRRRRARGTPLRGRFRADTRRRRRPHPPTRGVLNHLDIWVRKGSPLVPKPRILGADGAGIVEELGAGVSGFEPGQRVVVNPGVMHDGRVSVIGEHTDGTHAELIAVPATNVYPIPDAMSFEEAAAFPLVFETAYRMLVTKAALREGEWVSVGHRRRRRDRRLPGREGAGCPRDRHFVERCEARSGGRARRRRHRQSRDGRRQGHRARRDGPARRGRRRRACRRGDLAHVARRGLAGRADRRLRCDDWPEPAGRTPSHLVEGALDPRLLDGHEGGLRRRLRARHERPREGRGHWSFRSRKPAAHERLEPGEQLGKSCCEFLSSAHATPFASRRRRVRNAGIDDMRRSLQWQN